MKKVINSIFLKLMFIILKYYMNFHNDLPFLPKRMKIEKVEELVANLHDKTEYVIHIRSLKEALNHELVLKKVHRVITFNQNARLKPYIDINTNKKKKERILKNIFSR